MTTGWGSSATATRAAGASWPGWQAGAGGQRRPGSGAPWEDFAAELRVACVRAVNQAGAEADDRRARTRHMLGGQESQAFFDELARQIREELSRFLFQQEHAQPGGPGRAARGGSPLRF